MPKGGKKQSHEMLVKGIIIGDSGVGKTVLMKRFCEGVFSESYTATIGVDFKIKILDVDRAGEVADMGYGRSVEI